MDEKVFDPPLDPGISRAVEVLREHGIETFESCQGGAGHASPEPMIRFHGGQGEGFIALGVAQRHRLPVVELRREWSIQDGEAVGPSWTLVFAPGIWV